MDSSSTISSKTLMEDPPRAQPTSSRYEAFTICSMQMSTTIKRHSILKLFKRKSKTTTLSHREWGRLVISHSEIASYLSKEGSKQSAMDVLLSVPAEVAWSVSNILDAKNNSVDRHGRRRTWVIELVTEWPETLVDAYLRGRKREAKECDLKDYLVILKLEMMSYSGKNKH